ncbi:hypothetical protein AA13595_0058 [Gluconacetobacter johannae DSM 13595]|uniref:Uncharacterized protein n=1 Tax=Gluconacetobacter johannae TaxID=112140 RepID=A0A7W4J8P9_9PROT|nr:hypothetical protein [Gluconacetobacter johannae]MBB2176739.1 hypothetical protein [Gluconacetobacter johannae]GBQ79553.1 hypothetical protein AA13595_0058 [Gluconacetobacter johannae DSM 13595]
MVKVKSRPKCAQKTAAPVIVEDQIDAAIGADEAPTAGDLGRTLARLDAECCALDCSSERGDVSYEEIRKLENSIDDVWMKIEGAPVRSVADAVSALMSVNMDLFNIVESDGADVVRTLPVVREIERIILAISAFSHVDLASQGGNYLLVGFDEPILKLGVFAKFWLRRALRAGFVFQALKDGGLTVHGPVYGDTSISTKSFAEWTRRP